MCHFLFLAFCLFVFPDSCLCIIFCSLACVCSDVSFLKSASCVSLSSEIMGRQIFRASLSFTVFHAPELCYEVALGRKTSWYGSWQQTLHFYSSRNRWIWRRELSNTLLNGQSDLKSLGKNRPKCSTTHFLSKLIHNLYSGTKVAQKLL
jgi:hypothetical protein